MSDKKISQLSAASTPLAGTETLPIVQSGATVKVASDNLTVKNVRSNATTGILQIAGPTTGQTRVMTAPDANFTVARTDAAQSFTGLQTFNNATSSTNYQFNNSKARFASYSEWNKQSYVAGEQVRDIRLPLALDQWTTSASGSASVTQLGAGVYLRTNITAGSTATASIGNLGLSVSGGQGLVFYNNPIRIEFLLSNIAAQTANGQSWLLLRSDATTAADPSSAPNRAVGFRLDAGAIKGLTWNGTTLNVVDLATNMNNGVYTSLCFERTTNNGQFTFYVDGVEKGTAASISGYLGANVGLAVTNNGDSSRARFLVFDCRINSWVG